MKKSPLESLRRINAANGRYVYKLVVDEGVFWLNTRQLEERPEAVIAIRSISKRLNKMFKREDLSYNTILDIISRPPKLNKSKVIKIQVDDAFELMNQSLRNRA